MSNIVEVKFRKAADETHKKAKAQSLNGFKRDIEVTAFTASNLFGKAVVLDFLKELVRVMEDGEKLG